jgi:hypothetical protein
MKLLKTLVSFVVGTIVGVLAARVLGVWGSLLGFVVGAIAAWWVAQRVFDA